jgi:hypothetical protein
MSEAPIFIIGTERSGSNLLRLILNAHSRIVCPHPPHIVRYFAPLERGYGDLADDDIFRRFTADIARLIRFHINPWDFDLDGETLSRNAQSRDALGVCAAAYDECRARAGKARWACKSTFMIDHAEHAASLFPGARFIFLVRDPRDVAVSSRKSVFSRFHPFFTARLWRDQQEAGLRLLDGPLSDHLLLVRYEELIQRPHETVEHICSFIGEEFEAKMLDYASSEEARKSARLSQSWANCARPIISGNSQRFRGALSERELLIIEAIARAPMKRLGYEPSSSPEALDALRFSAFELGRFHLDEQLLRAKIELVSAFRDRNARQRWVRDVFVTWLRVRHGHRITRSYPWMIRA